MAAGQFDLIRWAQKDGAPPLTFHGDGPSGESGISVCRTHFDGAAHFSATARHHLVWFQSSASVRWDCRMAGRRLLHKPADGSLAICPAGIDCAADADGTVDAIVIAVDPRQLSLAAAEDCALDAVLPERLSGHDRALQQAAQSLVTESSDGHPNGVLFWTEAAGRFISHLLSRHTSMPQRPSRGRLDRRALQRIRDHVLANLAEPIEVADLAALAGRSSFHFSRVFARSVGVTPHRYVVHLRLQAAVKRMREGQMGLAEIALDTGFADQSHLTRWIRRVYGVAPSALA